MSVASAATSAAPIAGRLEDEVHLGVGHAFHASVGPPSGGWRVRLKPEPRNTRVTPAVGPHSGGAPSAALPRPSETGPAAHAQRGLTRAA